MPRLNLEQLRTFLVVHRTGGVGRAAQALNLTQPAVTARMKALEESLGTRIFDRDGGPGRLTKRGEMLLRHAQTLEALADRIEREIVDPAGIEGHLRIGASETIAQSWLPGFILALYREFPNLQIEFNVDVSVNLRKALIAREIDLAFLLGPISDHTVSNLVLPSFPLGWYADAAIDPGDPAAARLFDRPVITYARNTRPYRDVRDLVSTRLGPDVALFPSSSLSATIRLVASGLGVSPLPVALAEGPHREGELCRFDPGWGPEALVFTASWLADPPSHVAERAVAIASEVAEGYARGG